MATLQARLAALTGAFGADVKALQTAVNLRLVSVRITSTDGSETRPVTTSDVFWIGGTVKPFNMLSTDVWLSAATPTDPTTDAIDYYAIYAAAKAGTAAPATGTKASIFTTQVPSSLDNSDGGAAITTTTQFTSDINGNVTGVRFYRATTAPSSAIGLLYTDAGVELARANFGALSPGWNSVTFATPVAITAGTPYRVGYWTNYPYVSSSAFFGSPLVNGHLTATNGYYGYAAAPAFGIQQYASGCYFADVLFSY